MRTAPQVDAAGDQMTGRGPSRSSSHPSASSWVAPPDAFDCTRAKAHSPSTSASLSLKSWASSVSRSSFSGDTDRSATMQSPGSPRSGAPSSPPPPSSASEQAAASNATATRTAGEPANRCGSRGHVPPERVQGGHHARLQRRGEVVLVRRAPSPPPPGHLARRRCPGGRRRAPPRRWRWWPPPGPRARWPGRPARRARRPRRRRRPPRSRCPGWVARVRAGFGSPDADGSARLASHTSNSPNRGSFTAKSVRAEEPGRGGGQDGQPDREIGVREAHLQLAPLRVRSVAQVCPVGSGRRRRGTARCHRSRRGRRSRRAAPVRWPPWPVRWRWPERRRAHRGRGSRRPPATPST